MRQFESETGSELLDRPANDEPVPHRDLVSSQAKAYRTVADPRAEDSRRWVSSIIFNCHRGIKRCLDVRLNKRVAEDNSSRY